MSAAVQNVRLEGGLRMMLEDLGMQFTFKDETGKPFTLDIEARKPKLHQLWRLFGSVGESSQSFSGEPADGRPPTPCTTSRSRWRRSSASRRTS